MTPIKELGFRRLHHFPHLLWGAFILILCISRMSMRVREDSHASKSLFFSVNEKEDFFPWVGAGRPPPYIAQKHVRIVVRVHHMQDQATRSLIWSMRAQAIAAQHTSPDAADFTVDIALVATEEVGIPVVHKIARGMSSKCDQRESSVCHVISWFFICAFSVNT